jgi:hypothetical protein
VAYGPKHLFSSYSLLGLAVTEPFLAKTVVQNTNLGTKPLLINFSVPTARKGYRHVPVSGNLEESLGAGPPPKFSREVLWRPK